MLLKNAKIILPQAETRQNSVFVERGIIKDIFPATIGNSNDDQIIDLNGARLFAGFIDVHNHGAVGFDVNNANSDELIEVGKFLAKNGVTAWLPTLVPDSDENYRRAIDAINELMRRQIGKPVAQAVGVHYEGVFANEKMCGALRPEFFKAGS